MRWVWIVALLAGCGGDEDERTFAEIAVDYDTAWRECVVQAGQPDQYTAATGERACFDCYTVGDPYGPISCHDPETGRLNGETFDRTETCDALNATGICDACELDGPTAPNGEHWWCPWAHPEYDTE